MLAYPRYFGSSGLGPSDGNVARRYVVLINSRDLTAPPESPYQFVVESIDIGHQPFRTYLLPKFATARFELFDSPFEIFNIVFDQVVQPPLQVIFRHNQDKKTAASFAYRSIYGGLVNNDLWQYRD